MTWLEGFERRPVTNRVPPRRAQYGRTHLRPVNKIVLHTTEGDRAEGAFSAYDSRAGRTSGGVHPHLTVDPRRQLRWQHIPLDRASYSLKGGDRDGCIQIEIVGFSRDTPSWPTSWLDWLGTHVVAPVVAAQPGIPLQVPFQFLGPTAGLLAAPWPRGRARKPWNVIHAAAGITGHQHWPDDDHWDPSAIAAARICRAAQGATMDYTPTDWRFLEREATAAKARGIWNGDRRDQPASRGEVAVMVERGINAAGRATAGVDIDELAAAVAAKLTIGTK